MKRALKLLGIFLVSAVLGGVVVATWKSLYRPGVDEYRAHRYVSPQTSGRAVRATWFGTTAVLLSDGEHAVFADPFFTRPAGWWRLVTNRDIAPDEELIARSLRQAGVRDLDAVLVSHSHHDHAMDSAVVAQLTGAVLAGSASTANIGRGGGVPENRIRLVRAGEPMQFGSFRVTFIPSRHAGATGGRPTGEIESPLVPPARYFDYRQGGTHSIVVEHEFGSVLLHASAGYVPGALRGLRADVAFLGIALLDDLSIYLAEVPDAVGASRVIPTHWDDFTLPLDQPMRPAPFGVDLPGFFDGMADLRPRISTVTLEAGKPVVLFAAPDAQNR